MNKLLTSLAAAGAATLLIAAPAAASHEGSVYTANLQELNNSGASGTASVTVSDDGETMTVKVDATGFNLDGPHAQHIHGLVDGATVSASACPGPEADADGDGIITVAEGQPDYGAVQVALTTEGDTSPDSGLAVDRFASGTSVSYERAGIPIPAALKPNLGKLHIVVHGIDENGNGKLDMDQEERSSLDPKLPREATAPALCGTLAASATGAIQTGAGGTATNENSGNDLRPIGAGLAALTAVGFAGFSIRSRRTEA